VEAFEEGLVIETGERIPSRQHLRWAAEIPGLGAQVARLAARGVDGGGHQGSADDHADDPAVVASAVEFLLEGLHLARRLNKERGPAGAVYRR
jgi:magnesium chelatase subunit I